jgi:hypothetical protein
MVKLTAKPNKSQNTVGGIFVAKAVKPWSKP